MIGAMMRLRARSRNTDTPQNQNEESDAVAVNAVLDSKCWHEALGLHVPMEVTPTDDGSVEAGLVNIRGSDDLFISDVEVVDAFIAAAVKVHDVSTMDSDAFRAFCWCAEAFTNLKTPELRSSAVNGHNQNQVPFRERTCGTSRDEALHIFNEAVTTRVDHLSLQDEPSGCVSKSSTDSILRALHMLHLHGSGTGDDRAMYDSVLAATLAANWILAVAARFVSMVTRRNHGDRLFSTIMAALGVVAFNGASRLQGLLIGDRANRQRLPPAHMSELLVLCPLCRVLNPVHQAIKRVRACDHAPICCVCTDAQSDVCLPCGHLCLCEACFTCLPRQLATS